MFLSWGGAKFKNGAVSAALAYSIGQGVQAVAERGNANSREIINNTPDTLAEREAIYQEGLNAAKANKNLNVNEANISPELEVFMTGRRANGQWEYQGFSTKTDAINFLEANQSYRVVDGIHWGGDSISLYATSTAAGTVIQPGRLYDLYKKSDLSFSPVMSGVENVVQTLAHETGHITDIPHGDSMRNREFSALKTYRLGY